MPTERIDGWPRSSGRKLVAQNKKARHDYHIEDTYEAGLVLDRHRGEVAADGSRVARSTGSWTSTGGEAWLHGVHIPEYAQGTWTNHAARRKRKLLLNRAEIDKIERRVNEKGLTIVPLSLYFKDGRAKVEIALARGKKTWDKRHALAERQANREKEQAARPPAQGHGVTARRCRAGRRPRRSRVLAGASACPGSSTCTCTSCRENIQRRV